MSWRLVATIAALGVLLLFLGTCYLPAFAAEPAPAVPPPADPAIFGISVTDEDRGHWAFRPIENPQPPAVANDRGWIRNPIDAFILNGLRAKGLEPSPPADDLVWLRRVTFDLIGLPPTPEAVAAFLSDSSPDARGRAVDRLLSDPGYGIRWGRRWLDVVRYADTNGYERDGDKPFAWRYRDYVIESLNSDVPFDQFLTEQLAGDELEHRDARTMIATTLLRLGTWDDEPADPLVDRYEQLDDIVGTVSATFLGLTLRCARCHNHKFEPLSQLDYTRMLSIFEPLKRPQKDREDLDVPVGARQEVADTQAAEQRHAAVVKVLEEQRAALDERVRERFLESQPLPLTPEAIAAHRTPPGKRSDAQKKLVKETQKQVDEGAAKGRTADEQRQREGFEAALAVLKSAAPVRLPRAYVWEEHATPPLTQVFRRGNPATPAGVATPGFPAVLASADTEFLNPGGKSSTSLRRLSLARWMTDKRNPLAARVIVNRLWQGHFGNGLVATENDFGVMGGIPTHPELLDWLASELRNPSPTGVNNAPLSVPLPQAAVPWSLKHIHKLIVLSSTYAQSSAWRDDAGQIDVENNLLWRFPYRRLDAEAVRDSVLAVSGQLNLQMGGPGVYPKIAREVLESQSRPGNGWGAFDEKQAARRAIYIFVKRSLLVPEMELLDFADTNTSCEQRSVSTIPTQALTLLNGEFLNQQAAHFAARVRNDAGDDRAAQVNRAFHLAVSRAPTAEERADALAFLDRQSQQVATENQAAGTLPSDPPRAALEALCLVIFNLNEFAYVD